MEEAHRRHAKTAVAGIAGAERQARRRRPRGRLVDHADDFELGGGPAALSRERRRLSAGRPAAESAMGHQVRGAACRRTGSRPRWRISPAPARATSTRATWRSSLAADIQAAGGALSVEDLKPLPRPSARAAGDSLSRRQGVCDAGTHRRTDAVAHARPAAGESASPRAADRMRRPTSPTPRRCRRPIASG